MQLKYEVTTSLQIQISVKELRRVSGAVGFAVCCDSPDGAIPDSCIYLAVNIECLKKCFLSDIVPSFKQIESITNKVCSPDSNLPLKHTSK